MQVANKGAEAVRLLCEPEKPQLFDAVFMNLQLPEMDGYESEWRFDEALPPLARFCQKLGVSLEEETS